MLISCQRNQGKCITPEQCSSIVLSLPTSADLATCLECAHGIALAESCPFRPVRPTLDSTARITPEAPAVESAPVAAATEAQGKTKKTAKPRTRKTPQPKPAPVRTMTDEIEALRRALAYLLPQQYATLGVSFVEIVAQRHGLTADILDVVQAAGLTVKKVRKTVKFIEDEALAAFVKGI